MKKKIYVISEIGINHNGDMNLAKELIDKSYVSGADAVKFQKRTINDVYTQEELDTPRQSPFGTTNREQKEGLEFNIHQYKELESYTKGKGLDFIMSCWDMNSVELVEEHLNIDYHKVASALLTDAEFLKRLVMTGKPIILSVGMSNSHQVAKAMEILGDSVEYILACTSTYPTKKEEVNLNSIRVLKADFPHVKAGFSNHYSGLLGCVGAAAIGSECIEFHITKERGMYGSDQAASIENSYDLIKKIRQMEIMLGDGKIQVYDSEVPIVKKLRKNNTI